MRTILTLSAALTIAAGPHAEVSQTGTEAAASLAQGAETPALAPSPSSPLPLENRAASPLPGFAAALANQKTVTDAAGWGQLSIDRAWQAIVRSTRETRQQARWQYARSLIARERWADALGVLEAMGRDDPDLRLVQSYRLALGASQTGLGRYADALATLSDETLAKNPEACAWRMNAMEATGLHAEAILQWSCARPAIVSRTGRQRAQFLLIAARSALATNRPENALQLVETMPDTDPETNLVRGRALFALGKPQEARLRFARAKQNGNIEQRADAEVSMIEVMVAAGQAKPRIAYGELDRLSYVWRGDAIERRALILRLQLAESLHDDQAALRSGAALFRYHPPTGDGAQLLTTLQQRLSAILSPDSKVPLPEAAGLFWEYRDIAPSGASGDFLVSQLAERLQSARLYDRAAQLLDYQLMARVKDVSQGPLSVRVARLYILAGKPEDALRAISSSAGNIYPDEMIWARQRVEAIALHQLGRTDEALAVLDGVPDGAAIRHEFEWIRRDWKALAEASANMPARSGRLSEVEQAVILRRAVALAMLGREADISALRARYRSAFASLPTAPAFDLLTGPPGALDSAGVTRAMAAIPAASPAGDIADLLAVQTKEA